jgi:hypothetical protein
MVGGGIDDAPDGCCEMHLGALAAGLALSFVERRQDGKVINYWAPFRDSYKILLSGLKYVFDKQNKRYTAYQTFLASLSKPAIRVILPNSTRIAGVLLVIQHALRSMHALRLYASDCTALENKILTLAQWEQMAQFESVIRKAMYFCFDVQGNRVEIAGEMPLTLLVLWANYKYKKEYDVVDVNSKDKWTADTSFDNLPRVKMTSSRAKAQQQNLS